VSQFPGHDDEDDSFDDAEAADDYVAEFYDGIGDDEEEPEADAADLLDEEGEFPEETDTLIPLIAIVGRPNVGKSRLFNRLTGTRFAIVEDMPGVTRDRQYGDGTWDDHVFHVVDTGGFEPDTDDGMLKLMRRQAELAIEEAQIIFFVVDGQVGLVNADREIATVLRHAGKPVFILVNKVDGPRQEVGIGEFYELGFANVQDLSAEHGRNFDMVMELVLPMLPRQDQLKRDETVLRVAMLGRPNAGKSSIVNRILGEERLLTSDVAGTTRDSINTWIERDGQRFLFIDTAGIRRKRSISHRVEQYAVVQSFKAIDRADVVFYLIDATVGVTAQDQRILGLTHEKGRGIVLLLNKWDMMKLSEPEARAYLANIRELLAFCNYAPMMTVSAKTGLRVSRIFDLAIRVREQFDRRISTSELNRFLEESLLKNPPKSTGLKRLKVFYGSQVATRPPTFMFVCNDDRLVHFSYQRYIRNSIRDTFGFEGVPLKIFFRSRGKKEDEGKTE
jgi:GTP-binding protein